MEIGEGGKGKKKHNFCEGRGSKDMCSKLLKTGGVGGKG
jgi:hypothetical protein